MAAFMLQLFHKFERKVSKGKWKMPCKWLNHKTDKPGRQIELEINLNQLTENQGDILQQMTQVAIYMIIK